MTRKGNGTERKGTKQGDFSESNICVLLCLFGLPRSVEILGLRHLEVNFLPHQFFFLMFGIRWIVFIYGITFHLQFKTQRELDCQ